MSMLASSSIEFQTSKRPSNSSPVVARAIKLMATLAVIVWLPAARGQLAIVNAADALASLIGADTNACEDLLVELTGSDPATLLEGLTEGEAAELLELIADLTGLPAPVSAAGASVGPAAKPEFRSTARDLEERMTNHLWYGQMFLDVTYATPDKLPGQVVGLGGGGDSAIWSGHYLAAEAFRYALARQGRDHAKNNGQ